MAKVKRVEKKVGFINEEESYLAVKLLIVFTVVSTLLAIGVCVLVWISVDRRYYLIPTTTIATTTKANNGTQFSIGQYCQYSRQCPEAAFCSGTCQCPIHYYFNQTSLNCTMRKTSGASCNRDDECNTLVGLRCLSSTCQCDTTTHYWNTSYIFDVVGVPRGRCQNRKVLGVSCSDQFEGYTGTTYTFLFGSQIRRCWCNQGGSYYYSLNQGRCRIILKLYEVCFHHVECYDTYSMCVDYFGDGIKRCAPNPDATWYLGYRWKYTFGNAGCTINTYLCNNNDNLLCQAGSATCRCLDQYYYWNTTMCVYGSRHGEPCSASAQCMPATAGMVCDLPYLGALVTVCRCANGTRYYDILAGTCQLLKGYNGTCRDNTDCSGSMSNTMYCGQHPGGSLRVCLCTDDFYPNITLCVAKLAFNTLCTSTTQCMSHLNHVCLTSTTGRCGCASGKYLSSVDNTCQRLKYQRDACNTGIECWSGVCSSSLCN